MTKNIYCHIPGQVVFPPLPSSVLARHASLRLMDAKEHIFGRIEMIKDTNFNVKLFHWLIDWSTYGLKLLKVVALL